MIDTREWPCTYYSWITGLKKAQTTPTDHRRMQQINSQNRVSMISKCQKWYSSVPFDVCKTPLLVSLFLVPIYPGSSYSLQMATLFTEGCVSVAKGGRDRHNVQYQQPCPQALCSSIVLGSEDCQGGISRWSFCQATLQSPGHQKGTLKKHLNDSHVKMTVQTHKHPAKLWEQFCGQNLL